MILARSIFCPVVVVAGWLFYWNCTCNLKRLERYGYEVPDWKRNYRCGLESLKRQELSPSREKDDTEEKNGADGNLFQLCRFES